MIYLDSCALVKLVQAEEHSGALATHVGLSSEMLFSSELAQVEIGRTLTRHGAGKAAHDKAAALLEKITKLPINVTIPRAATLPGKHLRSLDALHLASAQMLTPTLTQFITYDKRLAQAAHDAGLPVVTPGTTI
ncbi:type II toxin-antitoxin system VapC family toxin [Umezawaea endophytica]|uniref:Type II toxin-antitoxin system VapC family toxin n=1 Tax=Umezawaea endophytica TaxID=1654476 RepID=A0A9X2VH43_9PSEU|nr:type II toxin-antitoxin system VapC family toxin [Umezawaea endophytica]MCS7476530.1 type II toxin-antitoxin system VapC family toxin [Umezawaea endophytica]